VHRAAYYLENLFPGRVNRVIVEAYVLTPGDGTTVSAALPVDANNYYYSACMSIVEGLRAIDAGFFTWSTVKLYYSVFYAIRAILGWDNFAVFRQDGKTPYQVRGIAGCSPQFIPGTGSHKSMINCFRRLMPSHFLLSQPVDQVEALDGFGWLLKKREDANYAIPRFCEPEIPEHYEQITRIGVRQAIAAYLDPAAGLLTFDKDHAIASFPLAVLRFAGDAAVAHGGAAIDSDELDFLVRKCRERNAVLAPLMTFIRRTIRT